MTNKKAIEELEELVIKQARLGLFNEEIEALEHAIEVLKQFDKLNYIGNSCSHTYCYADDGLKVFEVLE